MQSELHTTTNASQALDSVRIAIGRIGVAVRELADCLSSIIGGFVQGLRDVSISLRRLTFATLHPRQDALRRSSESTRRLLIALRHANQATAYMPATGNILAYFRWAPMNAPNMDSRGTHTCSPLQHFTTSLQVGLIGHRGLVSLRVAGIETESCSATRYVKCGCDS